MRKQIALSHAAPNRRHQEDFFVDSSHFEKFELSFVYGIVGSSRGFGGNSLLCWAFSNRARHRIHCSQPLKQRTGEIQFDS